MSFPSSWFQSLNALFIIIFAPMFAWLWIQTGHGKQPASPTKFSFGLIGVGLGFLVLVPPARAPERRARQPDVADPHVPDSHVRRAVPEPGRSELDDASSRRRASSGLMMGVWFLGASVGNFLGGQAASFYESMPLPTAVRHGGAFCRSSPES